MIYLKLTILAGRMHLILFFLAILASCQDARPTVKKAPLNAKGEYIYRLHDEYLFIAEPPLKQPIDPYPWEKGNVGNLPKITKEYFRCKGSSLNPQRTHQEKGSEVLRLTDCGGTSRHSLPLRNGKEFVYPILLDLLNHIQSKTGKRVVITCGHRCPEHNTYSDPTAKTSKHQLAAEVSFYVQGLEDRPESIIKLIQAYYADHPQKEFAEFKRYEKGDADTTTPPWMNKEIFVKLYKKKEGRNFDNRHPYPYIAIQVRYDREKQERVIYDWNKATQNYMRK
jgi:hypothetical protein